MTDTKALSRNCSIGNHARCLGTVLVYMPVEGQRIQPCQCSAADCPHGATAVLVEQP